MAASRLTGWVTALCLAGGARLAQAADATASSGAPPERSVSTGPLADNPAEGAANTVEQEGQTTEHFFADRGASVTLGFGLNQFTNRAAVNAIGPGASYELRFLVGTQTSVAYEVEYFGAVAGISALGLDTGAVLVSNGLQGLVHYNFTQDSSWQPYIAAGVGWRNYSIAHAAFNRSDANNGDNVLEVPLAAGIGWRSQSGLVIDARFAYRLSAGDDLLGGPSGGGPSLNNWDVGLQAGWRF